MPSGTNSLYRGCVKRILSASRSPGRMRIPHCTTTSLRSPASCLQISAPISSPQHHAFSTSPKLLKKGGKQNNKNHDPHIAESPSSTAEATDILFDYTTLETSIQKAVDRLKEELSKLRAGGRFNPEIIENLRVSLKGKVTGQSETMKLGELAQVVPRGGRTVIVMVGDKDVNSLSLIQFTAPSNLVKQSANLICLHEQHLKPITTTILSSPHSLTPQHDTLNPLQLNIPIPPPTGESRAAALTTANKAGEQAGLAIRSARQVQQKKLQAKWIRPDDRRKAEKGMEKVVEKGKGEVEKVVEGARKVLEER
ncbi:MAG: hypothetical protein M1827_005514 [Pycnora praestabilis]|nr:MAG: hypothetical protein M1827_005514 [Pycnora praestabilis]